MLHGGQLPLMSLNPLPYNFMTTLQMGNRRLICVISYSNKVQAGPNFVFATISLYSLGWSGIHYVDHSEICLPLPTKD